MKSTLWENDHKDLPGGDAIMDEASRSMSKFARILQHRLIDRSHSARGDHPLEAIPDPLPEKVSDVVLGASAVESARNMPVDSLSGSTDDVSSPTPKKLRLYLNR